MRFDQVLRAHRGWVIALSAAIPILACWLLSLVRDSVANTTAAIGLVLLVVAAAATGIRLAGIVAALSAAAGFDFFLTAPFNTLRITDHTDVATAVLLLLVGTGVSELAIWGRRQQARASREQGYFEGMLGTASAVAGGDSSPAELIDLIRNQIVTLLSLDDCRFDPATEYGLPVLAADGTLTRHGRVVDTTRHGLPTDTSFTIQVRSAGIVYGHYVLTAATRVVRPSREELRVAVMLAEQAGAALSANRGTGSI